MSYSGGSTRDYRSLDFMFDVLRRHPAGVTAKIVAAELKIKPSVAANRLSRLAQYGMLCRVPDPSRSISGRAYRYTPRNPQERAHV